MRNRSAGNRPAVQLGFCNVLGVFSYSETSGHMSIRTDSSFGYITPPERLWNHPWYPDMTRPSYVGYTGFPAWREPQNAESANNVEIDVAQNEDNVFIIRLYLFRPA